MAAETTPARRRGTATLVALCLTTALGVAVASYLALFSRSLELTVRQLQNDRTRELVETGLEEALWALNQDEWTASGPAGNTAWTTTGAARTVTLDYDLATGARGQVRLTVDNFAAAGPNWPVITVEAALTAADGRTVTRTVRAESGPAPLFGNAIASAEGAVSFAAGGIVDSWDSDPDDDPATPAVDYAFTAGAEANHAAVVAGRDDGFHGVVLTQAEIRGYVATFGQPVSFSLSAIPAARVLGPATAPGVDVDSTRLGRSAFVPVAPVFTVNLPPTSGPAYGGLLGGVQELADALLGAPPGVEVYRVSQLDVQGVPLLAPSLTVDRRLKIIVDGDASISGLGQITINPGASLELYVFGDCTIGGLGIDNRNIDPVTCAIFCLSSSTSDSLTYETVTAFRGVIYCENKPIDILANATFFGAILSRQRVSFGGGATAPEFHYDLALRDRRFEHVTTPFVLRDITAP